MSSLASAKAILYTYPRASPDTPKDHGEVNVVVAHVEKYDYTFSLTQKDKTLFCQIIEDDMAISFHGDALEWLVARAEGPPSRMRVEFVDDENDSYKPVLLAIARALIESTMNKSLEDCYNEDDREWALDSQVPDMRDDDDAEFFDFADEDSSRTGMNDDDDDEDAEGVSQPLFPETRRSGPESGTPAGFSLSSRKDKNSLMVSGMNLNRTFVSRGQKLGVFGHNSNDELEYVSRISAVRRPDGTLLAAPSKLQLHNADTQLLILDDANKNKIYNMDIETGRVLDEWEGKSGIDILNVAPRSKYAQVTNEQLVVGVSSQGIFSLDPRINERNKTAEEVFYTTKVGLTAAATTGDGLLAAASSTGDIRLSNKIQKNYCKTLLPGIGAPISHIEVTEDGSYLVATSKKCLIVFDLKIMGGKDDGKTGFTNRMGKAKPAPMLLKISAADMIKYDIKSADFTPARFNTGTIANSKEEYITSSTGDLLITWDFNKVKRGILSAYKIKKTNNTIVDDLFRHNFKEELLVAQTDEVFSSRINPNQRRK